MIEKARYNILVIKLGALGDFIQALGPMAAIRAHHPDSNITILTTKPFEAMAQASGYFDDIKIDIRPKWNNFRGWTELRRFFNTGSFCRVYDLQNNDRTAFYLRLFSKKPEWVGAARGASHRNSSRERTAGMAFEGHLQTLALAGITNIKPDTLSWLSAEHDFSNLPTPYILIVAGASPQHPEKRWPPEKFSEICKLLLQRGYHPVLLGSSAEKNITQEIQNAVPEVLNLSGQTSLFDLPSLARGAAGAIGNDTGPMHLIAQAGCPSIVLFSSKSNPVRHAPLGQNVLSLQKDSLADLSATQLWKAFAAQHSIS